jgi:hypothetical protein
LAFLKLNIICSQIGGFMGPPLNEGHE